MRQFRVHMKKLHTYVYGIRDTDITVVYSVRLNANRLQFVVIFYEQATVTSNRVTQVYKKRLFKYACTPCVGVHFE